MYRALQYVMDDSAIRLQGALKKKYRVSIKESNENSNTFSSIRHCVAGALYNVFRLISTKKKVTNWEPGSGGIRNKNIHVAT